jgi:hypothetical protein
MIDTFADLVPLDLRKRSGEVFYSGRTAFSIPSNLYLLGYNPGTDPQEMPDDTVEQNIQNAISSWPSRFSSYSDISWNGRPPGKAPVQQRVVHMLETAGLDPHEVPSSNLIFPRSRDEKAIRHEAMRLETLCWPFHQAVINFLGIKVIVCMGTSTAIAVRRRLSANRHIETFTEKNRREWKSDAHANETGIVVVRVTHPSRVAWTNPLSDPSPLVRSMLIA